VRIAGFVIFFSILSNASHIYTEDSLDNICIEDSCSKSALPDDNDVYRLYKSVYGEGFDFDCGNIYFNNKNEPAPYRLFQFVNSLKKKAEMACGGCRLSNYFVNTPDYQDINRRSLRKWPYISVDTFVLFNFEQLTGISIKSKNYNSFLLFGYLFHGGLSFLEDTPYFLSAYYQSKEKFAEAQAERIKKADSILKELNDFYGWDENRDTKYDNYFINFSKLNEFSEVSSVHDSLIFGNHSFENISYSTLMWVIRLRQYYEYKSDLFYTDIASKGYNADIDLRTTLAHIIKIAAEDGREILRFTNWPSGKNLNQGSISLILGPDPRRKALNLLKVLINEEEVDPNEAKLQWFWLLLAEWIEHEKRERAG